MKNEGKCFFCFFDKTFLNEKLAVKHNNLCAERNLLSKT